MITADASVYTLNSMLSLMWTLIVTRSPNFGLPSCAILSSSVMSSSSFAVSPDAVAASGAGDSCRLSSVHHVHKLNTTTVTFEEPSSSAVSNNLMDSDNIPNNFSSNYLRRALGKGKGAVPLRSVGGVLISRSVAVEPVGG